MKTENTFMKGLKSLLCLSLAFVMALALLTPVTAQAKSKDITVKSQKFTNTASVAKKKATKVSAGKTYSITFKTKGYDCGGFVKFVAPKSKTYTISVSNLSTDDGKYCCGSLAEMLVDPKHPQSVIFIDQARGSYSGKHWINIAGQSFNNNYTKDYPPKNKAKVKLNKGETLFLHYSFTFGYKCKRVTTKLLIK